MYVLDQCETEEMAPAQEDRSANAVAYSDCREVDYFNAFSTDILYTKFTRANMSGGFGGRNDMISSKFDPVSRDFIQREMLKKENECIKLSENFSINPKTLHLQTYTLKPTEIDPMATLKMLANSDAANDCSDPDLKKKLDKAAAMPQDKNKFPQTAAETIGWFWKEGREDRKLDQKWFQPLNKCEESKYAEAYAMMTGKSPYANTGAGIKK